MNQFQDMAFQPKKITIASIFPLACDAERHYSVKMSGGRTRFVLAAAEKGQYTTIDVFDSWELRMSDQSKVGAPVFDPFPVSAESIVKDLLIHWAESRLGTANGHRPGIMRIAGDVPTAEEIAAMNARQKPYFEGLYNDAQAFAAKHKWREINEMHRAAARWLGLNADWVADLGNRQDWKDCVFCFEKIPERATVCKVCHEKQPGYKAVAEMEAVEPEEHPMTLAQRAAKAKIAPPLKAPSAPQPVSA